MEGENESLRICVYLVLLRNLDVLTLLKFTATIHEVSNVRSSLPTTITPITTI